MSLTPGGHGRTTKCSTAASEQPDVVGGRVRGRSTGRLKLLSSEIFSTWPHTLQWTASGSWRSSPHCGHGWRTLPPGRNAAWARRKNSVMPTIIMATESSSPEVLPNSVTSPKPVVESAATVK